MAIQAAYGLTAPEDSPPFRVHYFQQRPGQPIPDEQKDCALATSNFNDELVRVRSHLGAGVGTDARLQPYIDELRDHFYLGCVKQLPDPKKATELIKGLRTRFFEDVVGDEAETLRGQEALYAGATCIVLFIGFAAFSRFADHMKPINVEALCNFLLVAAGAAAAQGITRILRAKIESVPDFLQLKRDLSHPLRHTLQTTTAAVFASLLLMQDVLTFKIGKVETNKVGSDPMVALTIGFVLGFVAGYLIRKYVAKSTKPEAD